ncbi:MAG: hypothetical protein G8237_06220 [Magnetococcales bacterium]|nr:hypothetical protein [Magnetococcales bacterium]
MGKLLRNKKLVAILALAVLAVVGGYLLLAPDGADKKKPIVVERAKVVPPDQKESQPSAEARKAPPEVKRDPVGTVSLFKGLVFASLDNNKRTLTDGAPVFEGDQIITGNEARLILKMRDEAVIALGPDSEFMIRDYRYAPKEAGSKGNLELNQGVVRFSTGKLGQMKNQPFKVVTPVATLGVRGTEGFVRLGAGKGKDREIEVITLKKEVLVWMDDAARSALPATSSLGEIHFSWSWSLIAEAQAVADVTKEPLSVKQGEKLTGSINKAPEVRKATRAELKAASMQTTVRKLSQEGINQLKKQAAQALVDQKAAPDLATAEALLTKHPDALQELIDKAEKKLEQELEKEIDQRLDQDEKLEKLDGQLKEKLGDEAYKKVKDAEERRTGKKEELRQENSQQLQDVLQDDKLVASAQEVEAERQRQKAQVTNELAEKIAAEKDPKKQAALQKELEKRHAEINKRSDQAIRNLVGTERASQVLQINAATAEQSRKVEEAYKQELDAAVPAERRAAFDAVQQERSRVLGDLATELQPLSLSRVSGLLQERIIQNSAPDVIAYAGAIANEVRAGATLEQVLQTRAAAVQEQRQQQARNMGVDYDAAKRNAQQTSTSDTSDTRTVAETETKEDKVEDTKTEEKDKTEKTGTTEDKSKVEEKTTTDTRQADSDPTKPTTTVASTTTSVSGLDPKPLDATSGRQTSSSGGGAGSTTTTTTTATVNLPPVMESQSFTVRENAPFQTVVGVLTASDPDQLDRSRLTFSLSDTSVFHLHPSTGQLTVFDATRLDYETNPTFTLTVTVRDSRNNTATATVMIRLTDVNEAPVIASGGSATFVENGTGTVYQAMASDPDSGDTRIWSLSGTDSALFAINQSGAVTFRQAPNFESPADTGGDNVYDVQVVVTDRAGLSSPKDVAITVTNVNESPAITSGTTANFAENGTGVAYQAQASDPDADDSQSWSLGGTDGALFQIDANGAVTFRQPPNFELPADAGADNRYEIRVTVADRAGLTASRDVTITVTNVNEAPTVTSAGSVNFAEGGTGTAYTATGTDPDAGDSITWSLGGADAARFTIHAMNGTVSFNQAPDFESPQDADGNNIHAITVVATDNAGLIGSKDVTITVVNGNDGPTITSSASVTFAENGSGSAYAATATDPDGGSALTWSLSGVDAALFAMDPATGVVTFRQSPDFEAPADNGADNRYQIRVTVTDGTTAVSQDVTITVTNVNETPRVTSGSAASLAENGSGVAYTATATDPDAGANLGWSLSGTDADLLTIHATTGEVTFRQPPNFEAPADSGSDNRYEIRVTVSDGALSVFQDVTITVTNVNEAPTVTSAGSVTFAENGTGTVYTATATDPDAGTTLSWSLSGSDAALFAMDATTGIVTFRQPPDHDSPMDAGADNGYAFRVTATDGGGLSGFKDVIVTVTNVNEAPVAQDDAATASEAGGVRNQTPGTQATGAVLANDRDPDANTTLTVVGIRTGSVIGSGTAGTIGTGLTGAHGVLTMQADGGFVYVVHEEDPVVEALAVGQSVTDLFHYTVSDGALQAGAVVTITIQGAADGPRAFGDSASATEAGGVANGTAGANASGNVLTNDRAIDAGSVLQVSAVQVGGVIGSGHGGAVGNALAGQYGALILQANGGFEYLVNDSHPDVEALRPGQTLTDLFHYQVSAGTLTDGAVVTITIQGANDAPVAVADAGSASVATAGTGSVLTNDTNIDSATLTVTGVRLGGSVGQGTAGSVGTALTGSHGALLLNANGNYTYTVDATSTAVRTLRVGQSLTDLFNYTISDGALSASATVTVTVQGGNDAPTITSAAAVTFAENGLGTVHTATATDPENDTITWSLSGPDASRLTIDPVSGAMGFVTSPDYETPDDANGDRVYQVTLTATDNGSPAASATQNLAITVTDVNETPEAIADAATAREAGGVANGTAGSPATGNLLLNDSDPDAQASLSVHAVRLGGVAGSGTEGTLGTPLQGAYGTLTVTANGAFVYAVNNSLSVIEALRTGQSLTDLFNYTVSDGTLTASAVLTITIEGANDAPTATDDTNSAARAGVGDNVPPGQTSGNLVTNDTDIEGQTLTVSVIRTGGVEGSGTTGTPGVALTGTYGALTVAPDGSYVYVINETLPAVLALGTGQTVNDTFNYTVTDGELTDQAVLTITVQGRNSGPVAVNDTGSAVEAGGVNNDTSGSRATGNVLTNDTDADSANLAVTAIRLGDVEGSGTAGTLGAPLTGNYGQLTLGANGVFAYVVHETLAAVEALRPGQSLTETFNYTVTDGELNDTATLTITIQGTDDAPLAVDDTRIVAKAGSGASAPGRLSSNALTNDTDIENDPLTVTAIRTGNVEGSGTAGGIGSNLAGAYGSLNVAADGSFVYTVNENNPAVLALGAGQTLFDTFNYTVSDGTLTDRAVITIAIQDASSAGAPVAVNDTATATEAGGSNNATAGSPGTGNVLTNDLDLDSTSLTVAAIRVGAVEGSGAVGSVGTALAGAYGGLTIAANGAFQYAVNETLAAVQALKPGQSLTDTFNYTVSDGALSDVGVITITIQGANDAPVATDDGASVTRSGVSATPGSASGNLLTNDTDAEADAMTVTALRTGGTEGSGTAGSIGAALTGTYGTLTVSANGAYQYTINETLPAVQGLGSGEILTDSFNYTVSDGLLVDLGGISVTIQGRNGPPVAANDTGSAREAGGTTNGTAGSRATGNVLTNDLDADSTTLTVSAIRTGDVEGSGTAGSVGTPVGGAYGQLTVGTDGSYAYVVNETLAAVEALKAGQSLTDAFNYTVSDGDLTDQAVLTITIQGANDAPVGVDDNRLVAKAGNGVGVTPGQVAGNVLTNDTDVESDSLTVTAIRTGGTEGSGTAGAIGTALTGSYGSLTLSATGAYVYTVNENNPEVLALGAGQTLFDRFNYTLSDGTLSDQAVLAIAIQGGGAGAPVAVNDSATAVEAGGTNNGTTGTPGSGNLLTNDLDVDSPTLTVTALRTGDVEGSGTAGTVGTALAGTHGQLTVQANGTFTYTINETLAAVQALKPGQTLSESFNYTVSDGTLTDSGVVTITLQGADDAPVATDDTASVTKAGNGVGVTPGSVSGNLVTNDTDVESDTLSVTAIRIGNTEGSGTPGALGAPLAGAYGAITVSATGAYVYTLNESAPAILALGVGQTLTETFNYTVAGGTLSDQGVLTITIQGSNSPPVAVDDSGTAIEAGGVNNGTAGTPASGNLVTNDTDDTTLTITAIRSGNVEGSGTAGVVGTPLAGAYGQLTVSASGTYTYVVDDNLAAVEALRSGQSLTDRFNYTVSDGAMSDQAVVTITIQGANDAPVGVDDTRIVAKAGTAPGVPAAETAGNVLTNDTDIESDTLSVAAIRTGNVEGSGTSGSVGAALTGSYGTLTMQANGSYLYTVNETAAAVQALGAGQTLFDVFNYTLSDGSLTDAALLSIAIQGGGAGAPVAVNDTATATEAGGTGNGTAGTNPSGNLLTNDLDADSPTLTVTGIRTGDVEGSGTVGTIGSALLGTHGQLTVAANGAWSYTLNNTLAVVEALKSGQTLTESFNYTVSDGTLTDTGVLTITIEGANDAPVGVNDTGTASKAGAGVGVTPGSTSGNLVTNDTDVESDTLTVTAIRTGATEGSGTAGNIGVALAGSYGTLTVAANGAFVYTINESAPAVVALGTGQVLSDIFNYTVADGNLSDHALLTITIQGSNQPPVAVDDTATATEAGGVNNGSAGSNPSGNLLTNDTDADSPSLTITAIRLGDVEGSGSAGIPGTPLAGSYGQITVQTNGAYQYTLNQSAVAVEALKVGQTLNESFNYTVSDGTATDTGRITITIQGANDAPTVTSAATASVAENSSGTIYTATATDPEGDGLTWSLSGVDAALFAIDPVTGALSFLVAPDFENPADAGGNNVYDVTLTATDHGSGALAGTLALAVTVTNANDAPTITLPTALTASEETPVNLAVTVADVDAGSNAIQVTLSVANGTLTLTPGSGVSVVSGSNGSAGLGFTGTLTQINAALSALTYRGATDYAGAELLTVGVDDLGNSGAGGPQTASASLAFQVDPVNDAPTVSAPTAVTADEDVTVSITGFAVADVDAGTGTIQATVATQQGGLTLAAGSGVTITSGADGAASITMTGTLAQINAAIATLAYRSQTDYAGSETVSVSVSDQGNTGSGGAQTASGSVTFTVAAVNDAPTIAQPTNLSVNEDAPLTFTTLSVADVDVGSGTMQLTLAATNGTLTLAAGSGVTLVAGGDHTANLTITGTLTQVNSALNGLIYQGNSNYYGAESITLTVSDQGNTGTGGAQSASATLSVTVIPVNDGPTVNSATSISVAENTTGTIYTATATDPENDAITWSLAGADAGLFAIDANTGAVSFLLAPDYEQPADSGGDNVYDLTLVATDNGTPVGSGQQAITVIVTNANDPPVITVPTTQTATEDTPVTIPVGVTDSDAGTNTLHVTLAVANGTLTLTPGSGVSLMSGSNGSAGMGFTGTLTQINAALSALTYQGGVDYSGQEILTVVVNDLGNSGPGGAMSATGTLTFQVSPVNDAPVVAVPTSVTATEDTPATITGFVVTDVDAGSGTMQVTVTALHGGLTLSTGSGVIVTAGADGQAVITFTGTLTQINAALVSLGYLGQTDHAGSETVSVSVSDLGNTGSGGALTGSGSVTFNVDPVNDAPTITQPAALSASEDTPLPITGLAVADVDVGTGVMQMVLTVQNGTLTLATGSGVSVTAGADGSASLTFTGTLTQINAALNGMSYLGSLNYNGNETLSVTISDQGNTGSGGAQSASANIAFTVAAVNDAPTVTSLPTLSVPENSSGTIYTATATDVENETITWSLSGADAALFAINPNTGEVSFLVAPDFENPGDTGGNNVYDINVVATDNGTPVQSGSLALAITVTNLNDPPTIAAPASVTATEDTPVGLTFTVADGDAGTGLIQATLAVANGTLTLNPGSGVTVTSGSDGSAGMTLSGTVAQINLALTNLTYLGNANYAGSEVLTLGVDDLGNTGPGGPQSASVNFSFQVDAVNDAPQIAAPTPVSATEDIPVPITGFVVSDVDVASGTMEATLSALHGTLTLTTGSGVTITSGADGSGSMVFTGTLAQINAAVATVTYQSNAEYAGAETVTLAVSDLGNTGSPGAQTASVPLAFTVAAVNDAPTVDAPTLSATEDTQLPITTLSVNDVDAGATATVEVSLSVTRGTLAITANSGVTITAGADGSATLTMQGTLSQLNTALNGMIYTPTANDSGNETLTVVVSDLGNTGPGGPQVTTVPIAFTVSAVNDAPVISGSPVPSVTVDVAAPITGYTVDDVDVGSDPLQATISVLHGTVTLSAGSGVTVTSGANGSASMVFTGTLAQINAAIATLTYQNAPAGYLGPETLTLTISDQGSTGAGGPQSHTVTLDFTVAAVNAPTNIVLSNTLMYENAHAGSVIGELTAVDPEVGDTFTFTLEDDPAVVDDDPTRFAIRIRASDSRVFLAVSNTFTPVQGSYKVTIRVTDARGLSLKKLFTITVNPVPFDLNAAADVVLGDVAPNAHTAFKDIIVALRTAPAAWSVTNAALRDLILGKLEQQFSTSGLFPQNLDQVVKRLTVEVYPTDDPTVIRIMARIGVINLMYNRLPTSVKGVFDGLFDTFAPYAGGYTTDIRIRLVPVIDNTNKTIGLDPDASTVDVLHLQIMPEIRLTVRTLVDAYNLARPDLKTVVDPLTFFIGGGGKGPGAQVLASALAPYGMTPAQAVDLQKSMKNTAILNGVTDQYVPGGDGKVIPFTQRFDYYLPGWIDQLNLVTGQVTLNRID